MPRRPSRPSYGDAEHGDDQRRRRPTPTLTTLGFKTFHRVVPSDNVEGTQAAVPVRKKGYKKVVVIDDLSDYGKGVADAVQNELQKGRRPSSVSVSTPRPPTTARRRRTVASSGSQAMFYGGYDAQAGQVAKALTAANYSGDSFAGNGGKSTVFTKGAGAAGDGWFFTCGCSDATTAPAAQSSPRRTGRPSTPTRRRTRPRPTTPPTP